MKKTVEGRIFEFEFSIWMGLSLSWCYFEKSLILESQEYYSWGLWWVPRISSQPKLIRYRSILIRSAPIYRTTGSFVFFLKLHETMMTLLRNWTLGSLGSVERKKSSGFRR